jgi:hypothetical protein
MAWVLFQNWRKSLRSTTFAHCMKLYTFTQKYQWPDFSYCIENDSRHFQGKSVWTWSFQTWNKLSMIHPSEGLVSFTFIRWHIGWLCQGRKKSNHFNNLWKKTFLEWAVNKIKIINKSVALQALTNLGPAVNTITKQCIKISCIRECSRSNAQVLFISNFVNHWHGSSSFSQHRKNWRVTVFWVVAPCSLIEADQCLRGAYCLHHQRLLL